MYILFCMVKFVFNGVEAGSEFLESEERTTSNASSLIKYMTF